MSAIVEQFKGLSVAERDQILQFLGGMAILVGVPFAVIVLVIRGIVKRKRAHARWRECARRNGWTQGPGGSLLSGTECGMTWTFGVEGSEQDDIVWRINEMPHEVAGEEATLRRELERLHPTLPQSVRRRFPLHEITLSAASGSLALILSNRDVSCEDAEGLVALGIAISRHSTCARPR